MSDERAKIDVYISKAQPFAVAILETLRARIHIGHPDIKEAYKWSMPAFMYNGKILCTMASFKHHATFAFWHGALVTGEAERRMTAMGDLGKITSIDQVPDQKTMTAWLTIAAKLIDDGVKPPHVEGRGKHPKPVLEMVPAFATALAGNAVAQASYDAFAPSCRREYLEWITEAKREETRSSRIAQAVVWLAEGKKRNWKYENC